ncbi:hypothetical protein JCM10908_002463 [Rhodotorula pacifica]|uniref:uncharacterized protein n=1 Tax=Rhodotorula pacifica TaxID=1495444 RepID=UPI00316BCD24
MSTNDAMPQGFHLLGGLPQKSPDLAASICFIIAYSLLSPLVIWRVAIRRTRLAVLIRPGIVLLVRIATFVIRALEADGKALSTGLITTEQVLLYLGLIPLCEPLLALTRYHIRRFWTPSPREGDEKPTKSTIDRGLRLLELALLGAMVLGVTIGSKTGSAMNDPSQMSSLTSMRYALYGLTLLVVVGGPLLATYATLQHGLPQRPVLFLYACAACLAIATIYKLIISLHPVSSVSHGAKAAFYLFNSLPEFLCTTLYFAFDLDALFDVNEGAWKRKVDKQMDKGKWTGPYVPKEAWRMQAAGGDVAMDSRASATLSGPPSPYKV